MGKRKIKTNSRANAVNLWQTHLETGGSSKDGFTLAGGGGTNWVYIQGLSFSPSESIAGGREDDKVSPSPPPLLSWKGRKA